MYCVFSLLSGSANPAHHPPHFMLIKDKGTTTDRPALERHGVLSLVGVWLECSAEALDDRTTLPGLLARLHQWQSAVHVVRMKWRLRLPSAATDEVKAAAPRVNIALITAISDDSSLSSLMTHQCHTPPRPQTSGLRRVLQRTKRCTDERATLATATLAGRGRRRRR
jgi:hypothetical protein